MADNTPPRTLKGFLTCENGGITKKALIESAIAAGLLFGMAYAVSAEYYHNNALTLSDMSQQKITAKHTHHSSQSRGFPAGMNVTL